MTTRTGVIIAVAVALAIGAWRWKAGPKAVSVNAEPAGGAMPTRLQPEAPSLSDPEREAPAVSEEYRREVVRPKPVQNLAETSGAPADDPSPAPPPGEPSNRRRDDKKTLPEIFRMPPDSRNSVPEILGASRPDKPKELGRPVLVDFAPFGRLIKCQLANTLDSITARSEPIIALTTQDLDWNGRVIIPAGTEALSYARPEPVIDATGVGRLVDDGEWTLILPGGDDRANGRELILKARAIDRREAVVSDHGDVRSWGIDDGADGLIGYALSTLDNEETKLFAAAAIGGLAQGFSAVAERQEPAPGVPGLLGATQIAPTIGNALAGSLGTGAADVMNQMAARIHEEIAKRGVYVRVPAGKQFYIFVEQTIDPRAAAVGLRLPEPRSGGNR